MDELDKEGFNAERRDTIKMSTGSYVNPWTMTEDDVNLEDVAHSNSHDCRFNGHTSSFWSVAQHEILVAALLVNAGFKKFALAGLVHDGGEAYARDLPSPIKHHPELSAYRTMEGRCGTITAWALGAENLRDPIVKAADIFARRVEQIAFMGSTADPATFDKRFSFSFARRTIQMLAAQGPAHVKASYLHSYKTISNPTKKVTLWLPGI